MSQSATSWPDLLRRWDEQQARYLPAREERFAVMLDVLTLGVDAPRVLDLGSGPGALSARILERFPEASILALDFDPAHLELGRRTLGDRVEWREADLRGDDWREELEPASFDAVVSATAIHWFQPDEVGHLYEDLAVLLRKDGLLLNADHLPVAAPRVAEMGDTLLERWQTRQFEVEGAEDYDEYRDALREAPELRLLVEEGDSRIDVHGHGVTMPFDFHADALRSAGFAEVAEAWRYLNDAVLVAIR